MLRVLVDNFIYKREVRSQTDPIFHRDCQKSELSKIFILSTFAPLWSDF